jgi:hypothetical protein
MLFIERASFIERKAGLPDNIEKHTKTPRFAVKRRYYLSNYCYQLVLGIYAARRVSLWNQMTKTHIMSVDTPSSDQEFPESRM